MSAHRLEVFLARLYADEAYCARFIAAPEAVVDDAGLEARERQAVLAMDPLAVRMSCRSFGAKRRAHGPSRRSSFLQRLKRSLMG